MLVGVGVMVLSFPINAGIARLQTRMQKQQMKNKDSRTRLMNEILNNIKSIKLYSMHIFQYGTSPLQQLTILLPFQVGNLHLHSACLPFEMTENWLYCGKWVT